MRNKPTANQISYLTDLVKRTRENLKTVTTAERWLSYEAKLDPVEKVRRELQIHAFRNLLVARDMKMSEVRKHVPREELQLVRERVEAEMVQEAADAVEARAALTDEEISEMTAEEVSTLISACLRQPW